MTRCTGPGCRQGRAQCPTPDACRVPEPEGARAVVAAFIAPVVLMLVALGAFVLEVMWKQ